jgi:hypothetical protein
MPRVLCDINYGEEENEEGHMLEATTATCGKCGHETTSFGTSEASVRRCLVMLREECDCPDRHRNFYVSADE